MPRLQHRLVRTAQPPLSQPVVDDEQSRVGAHAPPLGRALDDRHRPLGYGDRAVDDRPVARHVGPGAGEFAVDRKRVARDCLAVEALEEHGGLGACGAAAVVALEAFLGGCSALVLPQRRLDAQQQGAVLGEQPRAQKLMLERRRQLRAHRRAGRARRALERGLQPVVARPRWQALRTPALPEQREGRRERLAVLLHDPRDRVAGAGEREVEHPRRGASPHAQARCTLGVVEERRLLDHDATLGDDDGGRSVGGLLAEQRKYRGEHALGRPTVEQIDMLVAQPGRVRERCGPSIAEGGVQSLERLRPPEGVVVHVLNSSAHVVAGSPPLNSR